MICLPVGRLIMDIQAVKHIWLFCERFSIVLALIMRRKEYLP